MTELFEEPQYTFTKEQKGRVLLSELNQLTQWHRNRCPEYANILKYLYDGGTSHQAKELSDLPFFPVRLFKTRSLKSIPNHDVIKILTSSGTTAQEVSKVYLDKETALSQTKSLASIITSYILGRRNRPGESNSITQVS